MRSLNFVEKYYVLSELLIIEHR